MNDVKISPPRPSLGYHSGYPISVSGDCGVLSYLRRLVAYDNSYHDSCTPNAQGRWPEQSLIRSATRLAILGETTPGYHNAGGRLLACRIQHSNQFGDYENDLYFEVVDGAVEQPESIGGWKLMPIECNLGLKLGDHPRFCEGSEGVEILENTSRIQSIRWKDEVSVVPTVPLSLSLPATQVSAAIRSDAVYGYSFAPTSLSAEERAKRADFHSPARKYALIGGREIEVVRGSILWDGAQVPLESISGLCWQLNQKGSGWIRLRAGDHLFETSWDDAKQPSGEIDARKLVGILLSEIRQPTVSSIREKLLGGASERIGDALLERDGIRWTAYGFFGPKTILCTWKDVQTEIDEAAVLIKATRRRFEPVRVGLDVENAFALHFLPARMLSS